VPGRFTDRSGGTSRPPFDRLNLGDHVGDDPGAVAGNRTLVAAGVGRPVQYMRQTHGSRVAVVDGPVPPPAADALVTTRPGLALAVLVADCVPVLLLAEDDGVVAVAHAGRRGLAAGIVPATVTAMRGLGARRLRAVLGPAICGGCYELPEQLCEQVAADRPAARAVTRVGTPSLDLRAGLAAELRADGVPVEVDRRCTAEDPSLYSHRRDRPTGRFAGLAWLP
jgi:YfiH family protein